VATNLVALRQNGYGKRNYLQGFRHGLATENEMNYFISRQFGESLITLLTTLTVRRRVNSACGVSIDEFHRTSGPQNFGKGFEMGLSTTKNM
jgi:hypothetical protein